MQFMIDIDLRKADTPITYHDKLLLVGSCFTEHIGKALADAKFTLLQNPHGILFDPASVCKSLISYIENRQYKEADLFQLNEVWHSWDHHSRFSGIDAGEVIKKINHSQEIAHGFLKDATCVIITLGSSFSYRLTAESGSHSSVPDENGVANCHRAPAKWFQKHLLEINDTISMLDHLYHRLRQFNPALRIIFTVSPVRHLRDGVVENNRSKARLIEAVHHLVNKYEGIHYFPAYELVIDVLRDYRFYDVDLAHPNYQATEFVLEKFMESCLHEPAAELMKEIRKLSIARRHRPLQPDTIAHQQFLSSQLARVKQLKVKYPFLDLSEELSYFSADR